MLEVDVPADSRGVVRRRGDRAGDRRRDVGVEVDVRRSAAHREVPHRGLGAGAQPPRLHLGRGERVAQQPQAAVQMFDVFAGRLQLKQRSYSLKEAGL